ncbi:MAG: mitochondrial 37S ribosomal protein nam9 [Piccolia ochrophora]|nr:MAG: mitochondrial 37S ribosomal protein nam9 [Piccolia ochrophora]
MRKKFHGLKKIKIRQTWNKYNLYNLSRASTPNLNVPTYFQQKWTAKSSTRAYHGEQIREKQWQRMFRPRMASVVPMSHTYLAQNDGSEIAAGRGSGKDVVRTDTEESNTRGKGARGDRDSKNSRDRELPRTPYMHMVYAPIERRLDTAIFRALFASSARQARQFVVHGDVKVNGKKMTHPGYLLNPGDMFQVDPERVLYATGAPKTKTARRLGRRARQQADAKADAAAVTSTSESEAPDSLDDDASESSPSTPETPAPTETEPSTPPAPDPKSHLQSLIASAQALLSSPSTSLTAKRKQALRSFQREVRTTLSRPNSPKNASAASLDTQLATLLASGPSFPTKPAPTAAAPADEDTKAIRQALRIARDNPVDETKPYATPWRPRAYMSAFAFIPRFLEVNQNICAAVYLRHPVARPGLAEVPTPFHGDSYQLAFNWYLRRR